MTDDRFQYLSSVRPKGGKSGCSGEDGPGSVTGMYSFFQIYE
ncbi:hypothetical protein [Streptomyces zaomyceticus]